MYDVLHTLYLRTLDHLATHVLSLSLYVLYVRPSLSLYVCLVLLL